jgi:HlyD family secretion protein
MRKTLITLVVLGALGAAGWFVYQNYLAAPDSSLEERQEAVVSRGALTAMVNVTGTVMPEMQTTLSFKSAGRVARVWVEEGAAVEAGQILAELETTELDFAVQQAEMGLVSAQAQLLRLQRPPADYERTAAQAAVDSAQAAYDRLVAGRTAEEVRVARANLDQARAALDQAQVAYDQVADRPDVAMLPQSLQLQQATIAYEAAQANYELTMRPVSKADLAGARSAIVQAEAALARLEAGVAEEDLILSQIQVQQAQLSLDRARQQLESALLLAPHAGTVTRVAVREGELSGGQPAFVLTDLSGYHIELTVDEIDVGRVRLGQPVRATLDALPEEVLTGRLDYIAETAQFDAGLVTYRMTVELEPTAAALRAGMTANVEIITERREEVLLVPNRFIRFDRTTGRTSVDRLRGDLIQPVEIQIGLRDDTFSEVLAGLEEGDVAVLVSQSTRDRLQQSLQGGPPHP